MSGSPQCARPRFPRLSDGLRACAVLGRRGSQQRRPGHGLQRRPQPAVVDRQHGDGPVADHSCLPESSGSSSTVLGPGVWGLWEGFQLAVGRLLCAAPVSGSFKKAGNGVVDAGGAAKATDGVGRGAPKGRRWPPSGEAGGPRPSPRKVRPPRTSGGLSQPDTAKARRTPHRGRRHARWRAGGSPRPAPRLRPLRTPAATRRASRPQAA